MAIQKAGAAQFQDIFTVVGAGSFTVDMGNAATGSGTFAVSQITVPGADLGDFVLVAPGVDVTDAAVVGNVTAADKVDIVLLNNTAGAVNLGEATYRVVVLRLNAQYDVV
ncbi:MAG: hypothetical protein AB7Q37_18665 [Pyrinomonadaceae bacterium]